MQKSHRLYLDSLKSNFGKTVVTGKARVYDTEDAKKKTERPYLSARGMPKPKEEGAA